MIIASREVSGAGVGVEGQAGVGISYPEVDQVASRLRRRGRSSSSLPSRRRSVLSCLAALRLKKMGSWREPECRVVGLAFSRRIFGNRNSEPVCLSLKLQENLPRRWPITLPMDKKGDVIIGTSPNKAINVGTREGVREGVFDDSNEDVALPALVRGRRGVTRDRRADPSTSHCSSFS